jgi:hypothetical protein
MGLNSSVEAERVIFGGVLGLLLLLDAGLPHLWEFSEFKLSLFVTFTSGRDFVGVSGALCTFAAGIFMLDERPDAFSSTVLTDPSRALEDVVGASPESLFQPSSSLKSFVVLLSAG